MNKTKSEKAMDKYLKSSEEAIILILGFLDKNKIDLPVGLVAMMHLVVVANLELGLDIESCLQSQRNIYKALRDENKNYVDLS